MLNRTPIPDEFYCSLSVVVMTDPVEFNKQIYERKAIEDYLKKYKTHPITHLPITLPIVLEPDDELRNRIAAFREEHRELFNENGDEILSDDEQLIALYAIKEPLPENINSILIDAIIEEDEKKFSSWFVKVCEAKRDLSKLVDEKFKGNVLHWAADTGNESILIQILTSGASNLLNTQTLNGSTPLHNAASKLNLKTVELLLTYGADPHLLNNAGNTPLDLAFKNQDFYEAMLNIIKYSPSNRENLLFDLIKNKNIAEFTIEIEKIKNTPEIDTLIFNNHTLLTYAINLNAKDFIYCLLSNGTNPSQCNKNQDYPIHLAAQLSNPADQQEVMGLLKGYGATLYDLNGKGYTAFKYLLDNLPQNESTIKFFLQDALQDFKQYYSKNLIELVCEFLVHQKNDFQYLTHRLDNISVNEKRELAEWLKTSTDLINKNPKDAQLTPYDHYLLGYAYQHGIGVERDRDKAFEFFDKAARCLPQAFTAIGEILLWRHKLGIEGSIYQAKTFCKFAIKSSNPDPKAYRVLGLLCNESKEYHAALSNFELAIAAGYYQSLADIGLMHDLGLGVEKNSKLGFSYYIQSLRHGEVKALNNIGCFYGNGSLVSKDSKISYDLFMMGTDRHYSRSYRNIGRVHHLEGNLDLAAKWYRQSAEYLEKEGKTSLWSLFNVNRKNVYVCYQALLGLKHLRSQKKLDDIRSSFQEISPLNLDVILDLCGKEHSEELKVVIDALPLNIREKLANTLYEIITVLTYSFPKYCKTSLILEMNQLILQHLIPNKIISMFSNGDILKKEFAEIRARTTINYLEKKISEKPLLNQSGLFGNKNREVLLKMENGHKKAVDIDDLFNDINEARTGRESYLSCLTIIKTKIRY